MNNYSNKKLIAFDLDGTLAPSKSAMDSEMSGLLSELLEKCAVAVVSGGSYGQFKKQFMDAVSISKEGLKKLYLFPTNGSVLYRYDGDAWKEEYSETLTQEEKKQVFDAIERSLSESGYEKPEQTYGEIVEDRGTQVSFSALGQEAPLKEKEVWDPDQEKRKKIVAILETYLPESNVRIGGTTTIDITRKGIDKAYALEKALFYAEVNKDDVLFVGDAVFPGGNDYAAVTFGVDTAQVNNPEDTKNIIRSIIQQ